MLRQGFGNVLGEPCLLESGDRSRDAVALHCHLVLLPENLDLFICPLCNVLVLLSQLSLHESYLVEVPVEGLEGLALPVDGRKRVAEAVKAVHFVRICN